MVRAGVRGLGVGTAEPVRSVLLRAMFVQRSPDNRRVNPSYVALYPFLGAR